MDFVARVNALWANLNYIADKQESHQRTTLIVNRKYFLKLTNKSGDPEPTIKNGVKSERPND